MSEEDELTEEEIEALESYGYGYPKEKTQNNLVAFFREIIKARETTRTANLKEEEIGFAKLPTRTLLELGNFCTAVGSTGFANLFEKEAQILTNTSLGREGFLVQMAVTQKRETETRRKVSSPAQRRTWFKKKSTTPQEPTY